MEIINFVGTNSYGFGTSRKEKVSFTRIFNFSKFKNAKSTKNSFKPRTSLVYSRNPAVVISDSPFRGSFSFSRSYYKIRGNLKLKFDVLTRTLVVGEKKAAAKIWLFPLFAGLFFAAMFPSRIISYFENHTSPVSLSNITFLETEGELLKKAMEKFALEGVDFSGYDEDGNVLGGKGEIITAKQAGIVETVSYQTYKVKSGESISTIAKKFGLTNISTLISINDINNVRALREGQKLRIPSIDGMIHCVKSGESVNSIASKYGTIPEQILDANDLESQNLKIGQQIFVPGAKMDSTELKKVLGETWIMPIAASFRYTSMFGPRKDPFSGVSTNHKGVDMACPTGTSIRVVNNGTIAIAGWHQVFGNYVIVSHDNGYQTLYAHMTKILCRKGQQVTQGTVIGLVGSTGYSTGPHLHFQVFKNGKLLDPMSILRK